MGGKHLPDPYLLRKEGWASGVKAWRSDPLPPSLVSSLWEPYTA